MQTQTIIDELGKLAKEIDSAKSSVAQLEGRKTEIVKRLKEEFGVSNMTSAEKLLAEKNAELEELTATIVADFEELKANFSW